MDTTENCVQLLSVGLLKQFSSFKNLEALLEALLLKQKMILDNNELSDLSFNQNETLLLSAMV
jgi:hypothetical protein